MIRINLLPYREKRKKENLRRQITILAGTLVLFVTLLAAVHLYLGIGIDGVEKKIGETEARLAVLNKKVGDLEGFKRDKREIEQKLEVIRSLEGNRLFPVYLLDRLNRLVPSRQVWLEKVAQTGQELRIEGVARDNIVLARFMRSLEGAGFVTGVELAVSREKEVSGAKLQQFVLVCAIRKGG